MVAPAPGRAADPTFFARKMLGWNTSVHKAKQHFKAGRCQHANELTPQQWDTIASVEQNRRTVLKATHSMGKTELIGFMGAWWTAKNEHNIVLLCSAKEKQALNVIMPRVKRNWKKAFPEKGVQGAVQRTKIMPDPAKNEEWMALVISGRNTESWQGYHASFGGELLLIVDEGSAMTPELAFAAEGLISGGRSKLLVVGNALCRKKNAPFRAAFADETFNAITWNPYLHPNLVNKQKCPICAQSLYANAINPEWVAEQEKKYGKNSELFKMRVLAEFPEPEETGKRWIIDPHTVADAAELDYEDIQADDLEQSEEESTEILQRKLLAEGFTPEQVYIWLNQRKTHDPYTS